MVTGGFFAVVVVERRESEAVDGSTADDFTVAVAAVIVGRIGNALRGRLDGAGESLAVQSEGVGGYVTDGGERTGDGERAGPGDVTGEGEGAGGEAHRSGDGIAAHGNGLIDSAVAHDVGTAGGSVGSHGHVEIADLTRVEVVGSEVATGEATVIDISVYEIIEIVIVTAGRHKDNR